MLSSSDEVLQHYQSELKQRSTQLTHARKRDLLLSRVRVFLAVISIYFAYAIHQQLATEWVNITGLGLTLLLFFFIWRHHNRKTQQMFDTETHIDRLNQGIYRIARDWDNIASVPSTLAPSQTILDQDLNLFGFGSVGQLLFNMSTPTGDQQLASWLNQPGETQDIRNRQNAVTELTQHITYCQTLSVIAKRAGSQANFISTFKEWAVESLDNKQVWVTIARISSVMMLLGIILTFIDNELIVIPFSLLFFNGIITYFTYSKSHKAFHSLEGVHKGIGVLKALATESLSQSFSSPLLKEQSTHLQLDKASSLHILSDLQAILFHSQLRFNVIPYLVLQMMFLWDSHIFNRLATWKERHGLDASNISEALSTLEALSSLAIVAFENPEWCIPHINDSQTKTIKLINAGNPLIANKKCVTNDILLTPEQRLIIVTGSNMSGKTTYMRTLGINVKLALLGSVAFATEMEVPNIVIVSSMHVKDALHEGVSYFMSELLQLKEVMSEVQKAHSKTVLYLLDEVLKGTNNYDKNIATIAVLKALLNQNTLGMLTTHDIEIAQADELGESTKNVYFQEAIEDEQSTKTDTILSFDFKAKPGVIKKTNALRLVRLLGILDTPRR